MCAGFFCVKGGRVKGKNNIHKFPEKRHWPVNAIERKKQARNIESEINLEYDKDSAKKIKKWLRVATIWVSLVGTAGVALLLVFSYKAGKIWGFLDTYGDLVHGLWVLLPFELCGGIYGAYKNKKVLRQVVILVFVATLFLPMPISALKWGKIPNDRSTESLTLGEPIVISNPVEVTGAEVRYTKPYSRDEDIFVEVLELYYGVEKGAIAEEEEAAARADIIEKDIDANRKEWEGKTEPQLFWDNWYRADYWYRVYKKQIEILEEDMDTVLEEDDAYLSDIREYRIDALIEAKMFRKLADDQYEDAENQKLTAQYCIGISDEYMSYKSYSLALDNLQEGAEWAVKSIYSAIMEGNKDKMWKGVAELDNVIERLERMGDKISEDIILKVKDVRDAYRILIERQ